MDLDNPYWISILVFIMISYSNEVNYDNLEQGVIGIPVILICIQQ
jgi:hypothetical protein